MGEVYKSYDPRLNRHVAVKVVGSSFGSRPDFLKRFEREALAVSALTHKNICTIYDTGEHEGQPFIVMEYVEGDSVESLVSAGPLPIGRVLDIAIQVADALDAAHRLGIVHRDIKSANILLTSRGDAKVLDFGIAKMKAPSETSLPAWRGELTRPGFAVGTVAYAAPEQVAGAEVDARADLYSLGVVLFQMATGLLPYRGSPEQVLPSLVSSSPAPRAASISPSLPSELDRIIAKALEKSREERYQSAAEILADLRALRRDLTSGERTLSGSARVPGAWPASWWRRRAWGAPIAAALLAASIAVPLIWNRFAAGPGIRKLAVLPCSSAGKSASLVYLCSVVSENLIASLSQIPGLEVMSSQAVQRYASEPKGAVDAGRELGVDAVLTSVASDAAPGLDVAVEVTNVHSQAHIWGRRFRLPASEIEGLHEGVAREVAANLQLRLSYADRLRLELFQVYQQAQAEWNKRTGDGLSRAIALYGQVLERDSAFARAWSGLASAYSLLPYYSGSPPPDAYPRAREAAEAALRLDETLAEAHATLALVKRDFEWDWLGAEREFRRAIELDFSSGTSQQWYAELLAMQGRYEEALAHIRRAQEVMPASLTARAVHGWVLLCAGRVAEADSQLRTTVEMGPDHPLAHYFLGEVRAAQGRHRDAVRAFLEAARLSGGTSWFLAGLANAYALAGERTRALEILARLRQQAASGAKVSRYDMAVILAGLGQRDSAIRELATALADRDRQIVNLKLDPMLRPLRGDPRYRALVRRVGLPSE